MSVGRLFHTRGAATANARSPNLLRVLGTYRSPLSAVRNEARDGRSGLMRSAMYCGACPTSALWTSRHSLKSMLSAIGSLCSVWWMPAAARVIMNLSLVARPCETSVEAAILAAGWAKNYIQAVSVYALHPRRTGTKIPVRLCTIVSAASGRYRLRSTGSAFLPSCIGCREVYSQEKAVCLSVCLYVKRVHCDKTEERSVKIFIPYKTSFSLVFWE